MREATAFVLIFLVITLSQRVFVALVPLHELGDAVVQAPVGLVTAFRLEFRSVSIPGKRTDS